MSLRGSSWWFMCLGPCHPCSRPRRSNLLLALTWSNPSHCGHWRNESAGGRSLCLSAFQINLIIFFFKRRVESPWASCLATDHHLCHPSRHSNILATSHLQYQKGFNREEKLYKMGAFWRTCLWNQTEVLNSCVAMGQSLWLSGLLHSLLHEILLLSLG